jgi:small subunit ribosomal protein S20
MPIIKSAKKRVKVAARANVRNSMVRRNLRDAVKAFSVAVSTGKPAEIAKTQTAAVSAIDAAAKKNVIHKNKAARKKAQLAAQAKAAGHKPAKTAAKKPGSETSRPSVKAGASKATRRSTSGKPAAKRPIAAKPAISRTPTHK